jgi:hypothetical protein
MIVARVKQTPRRVTEGRWKRVRKNRVRKEGLKNDVQRLVMPSKAE